MTTKFWFKGSAGDWFTDFWATPGSAPTQAPPAAGDDVFLLYNSGELDVSGADTAAHGALDNITFHFAGVTGQPIPLLVSNGATFGSNFVFDNLSNDGLGTFKVLGTTSFAGMLTAGTAGANATLTLDIEDAAGVPGVFDNTGTITVSGEGSLSVIGTGTLLNEGIIEAGPGTMSIAVSLVNNQFIEVQQYANLTITGAITGTGTISVDDQASVVLDGAVGSGQSITFASGVGLVMVGDLAGMQGQFTDLTGRDAIDLVGVTATSTRYDSTTSTLSIYDGTSVVGALQIADGAALNTVSDQDGGTILTLDQPGAPAVVAQYEVNGPNLSSSGARNWLANAPPGGGAPTVYYQFAADSNFTTAQQQALIGGLNFWSAIANIDFAVASSAHPADLTFDDQADGQAVTTLSTSGTHLLSATVNIDTTVPGFSDITDLSSDDSTGFGGYGYTVVLHEEGHVLGLYHPGNYNETIDLGSQTVFYDDSRQYSVMSYVPAALTGADYTTASGTVIASASPGLDDMLAAQSIYGANTTTLTGHDVFGFNSTFGTGSAHPIGAYDFTQNPTPVATLYDAGPDNTLDLSGFSLSSTVNLIQGAFSSVNGLVHNIAIAYGAVIDAVVGGSGADSFVGNADDDDFTGGGGNDTIRGGTGADNTAIYRGDEAAYTITPQAGGATLVTDSVAGRDGTDTLYNIQTLRFADGSEQMACYVAGTRIATPAGEIAVEALSAGDLVSLAGGGAAPVIWIGHRRLVCRQQADPVAAWPVRVRAGAFGNDLPRRDLFLSPEHAVFAEGKLVPIRHLLNGVSIARCSRPVVTYFHIELAHHSVILAEGLPAETWLDTGNRAMFANAPAPAQRSASVASERWAHAGYAPLMDAEEAAPLRRRLTALARMVTAA